MSAARDQPDKLGEHLKNLPVPSLPDSPAHFIAWAAGLSAVIYGIGGASLFAQSWVAGIPAGDAIDKFTARRFILIGAAVFAAMVLLAAAVRVAVVKIGRHKRLDARSGWWIGAFVAIAVWIVVLLVWPMELQNVDVRLTSGSCISGDLLSWDSSNVNLAGGKASPKRLERSGVTSLPDSLRSVPLADVQLVSFHGQRHVDETTIVQHAC